MTSRKAIKHYKCKACGFVVANRGTHLGNWHDEIDRFLIREMEGKTEESETFFNKWFDETTEELTSKIGYNYNPSITSWKNSGIKVPRK